MLSLVWVAVNTEHFGGSSLRFRQPLPPKNRELWRRDVAPGRLQHPGGCRVLLGIQDTSQPIG